MKMMVQWSYKVTDTVMSRRRNKYMAEYIKRANLIARIKYYITHTLEDSGEHYAYSVVLDEILNHPTADVVPVVRCKDCKYAYINP